MPNQVHIVVEQLQKELHRIMMSHKRYTARQANIILNRTGRFWQKEYYDHLVRHSNELSKVMDYVLNNPVKAGFVDKWEDWPFSYCRPVFL